MTALPAHAPPGREPDRVQRRPLRVAALIDTHAVSGPGRQLAGVAGALTARGVEMRVVLFHRDGRPRPPFADFLERIGIGYEIIPEGGRFDLTVLGRLRLWLDEWGPDVVETHSYKASALVYLLRRMRKLPQPWVGFFHGATTEDLKVRVYHWLDVRLLADAERTVVMSQANRRDFAALGDRVRVLYNSVVPLPAAQSRLELPEHVEAAVAGGARLVGVVGRLSPEKGVDIYLRAIAELDRRGVRFASVLAGDGPMLAASKALVAELGIADRVAFIGSVQAMQELYTRLDLLVIPSRSEGLPNVLLEALRADVPVVSTRVGAVPEVLAETRAGVMVEPGNVEALAAAIAASLDLKDDAGARAARAEVAERFSLDHRADEHRDMYQELVDCAARARRG